MVYVNDHGNKEAETIIVNTNIEDLGKYLHEFKDLDDRHCLTFKIRSGTH